MVPSWAFKHFMNFKGEEGRYMGLAGTDDGFMYDLMRTAAGFEQAVIVAHPENIELVNRIKAQFIEAGRDGLKAYCRSKPTFTESEVETVIIAADGDQPGEKAAQAGRPGRSGA